MKMSPEFMQTKEGQQMMKLASSLKQPSVNNHPCNHSNKASNHTGGGKEIPPMCANSLSLSNSVNNVSVSTSTNCTEPDCDGNHDDNYDSIDDNCSEKSSSTSNSTSQKEGKYCDCCYCEFFGHGNPPVAPTSKNYAEMRDKLRLRLKKKQNEVKSDEPLNSKCSLRDLHSHPCTHAPASIKDLPPVTCGDDSEEPTTETRGLDELISFINGTDKDGQGNQQLSAKAAKRARQKRRKAEEKARQEEERLMAERREMERRRQEEIKAKLQAAMALENAARMEGMTKRQKKQAAKQARSCRETPPPATPAVAATMTQSTTSNSSTSLDSSQEKLGTHASSKVE